MCRPAGAGSKASTRSPPKELVEQIGISRKTFGAIRLHNYSSLFRKYHLYNQLRNVGAAMSVDDHQPKSIIRPFLDLTADNL